MIKYKKGIYIWNKKIIKEYEILSSKIINNKIDETYSICDFYKTNVILYSDDGINYKSDINCDI